MINDKKTELVLPRRRFLTALGGVSALMAAPSAFATSEKPKGSRKINLHNMHTGEKIRVDYWIEGQYQPEALAGIDMALRDHHANEIISMDTDLIELLHKINQLTVGNPDKPIEILSAYRSPETNKKLRKKRSRVAKNSYHMVGKAVDVKIPGVTATNIFKAAAAMKSGGVGYYGRSSFIHLDVGNFRTWGRKRA